MEFGGGIDRLRRLVGVMAGQFPQCCEEQENANEKEKDGLAGLVDP